MSSGIPPMAVMSSENEALNFYRLVSLLVDTGSSVLRKLLTKHVQMQKTTLDKHLSNNKTKLEKLQTKKHVLHQQQMDLMFPSSGSADIDKFDITLLSCILKNTCGKLPQQEKQEIEELKRYRNEVSGHTAKAAISEDEFKCLWVKVKQSIENLAKCSMDQAFLNEVRDDIKELSLRSKIKSSSQLTELLLHWEMSDKKLLQRIDERHAEFTTKLDVIAGLKKHDPVFEKLKHTSQNFFYTHSNQQYVKTTLMTEVEDMLKEKGSCVISGNPGEGKTLAAVIIMKELFNVENCLVLSRPKDWESVDFERTEAIFIDDIFGMYKLDDGILSKWLRVLDKVCSCTGTEAKKIKVLVSTRASILGQCCSKLSRFSIFNNVVKFSSDRLSQQERRDILELSLQNHRQILSADKISMCAKQFTCPIGFPFCCHLFSSNVSLFNLGEKFFRLPFKFFTDNFNNLDKGIFASLVFLFYRSGRIDKSDLNDDNKSYCNDLREISSRTGMSPAIMPSAVKLHLEKVRGVYVNVSKRSFTFVHNSVSEAVGLLYGQSHPHYVVKNCSSAFLHQCVIIGDNNSCVMENTEQEVCDSEGKLMLPRQSYGMLAERLITEVVEKQNVTRTVTHPALFNGTFTALLVQTIRVQKCKKMFFAYDADGRLSFLTEFIRNNYKTSKTIPNTATDFFRFVGRCKHILARFRCRCWKCNLKTSCINIVCEYGNKDACLALLELGTRPNACTLDCAIKGGNVDTVKLVMEHGVGPDTRSLNLAAEKGNFGIVSLVMGYGARPDICTLYHTVNKGNAVDVKSILDHGVVPNARSLKYAIESGSVAISQLLIEHGVVPSPSDIAIAAQVGNIDIMKTLIDLGSILDATTLRIAVRGGNVDVFKQLMEHGAAPDSLTLDAAAREGHTNIVKLVLEHGVAPDSQTLNYAAGGCMVDKVSKLMTTGFWTHKGPGKGGNIDMVRLVLEHGAQPDRFTLSYAACGGNHDIVRFVIEHGAVTNEVTMICAIFGENMDIVRKVVEHGASPDEEALNFAVRGANVDIVRFVMEHGAIADTKTLYLAVLTGSFDICRTVLEHGAVPDKKTLDLAVHNGNFDIVKALVEHGAVPDKENLNFSKRVGNEKIVKLLVEHEAVPEDKPLETAVERGGPEVVRTSRKKHSD